MKVKGGKVVGFTAMKVKGNGRFAWKGDIEPDGTITMAVKGRIAGGSARGAVTLTRPDSHYDVSEGMPRFGTCGARDRPWTARVR